MRTSRESFAEVKENSGPIKSSGIAAGKTLEVLVVTPSVSGSQGPAHFELSLSSGFSEGWCRLTLQVVLPATHADTLHLSIQPNGPGGQNWTWSGRSLLAQSVVLKIPPGTTVLQVRAWDTTPLEILGATVHHISRTAQVCSALARQLKPLCGLGFRGGFSMAWSKLRKALAVIQSGGWGALLVKFSPQLSNFDYRQWCRREELELQQFAEKFSKDPSPSVVPSGKISVLMPTWNTPADLLRRAIGSVQQQIHADWELCIADDNSSDEATLKVLRELTDPRIKVRFLSEHNHIATTTNAALALAEGDWMVLLDHDDELAPHALLAVATVLRSDSEVGFIYSDEDKLSPEGERRLPYFKSAFNPALLLSQNYICHLAAMKTSMVRELGGFRFGFDGAQDWDLFLRITEKLTPRQIVHLPYILYHWRESENSTAQSTAAKPYVLENQAKVVREHFHRLGLLHATVEIRHDISQLRPHLPAPQGNPLVSIIILTRDKAELLEQCLASIFTRTHGVRYEVVVIDNGSLDAATFDLFQRWKRKGVRVERSDEPFNFARLNNYAVQFAKGELLLFLNNDIEVRTEGWLVEMLSWFSLQKVGAVGCRLLYPDNTVQHAGVVVGIGGVAGHVHKGCSRFEPGSFNRAILPQDLSAVTAACMLIKRTVFESVGGFSEELAVAFNDIDLCLKVRQAGYRILYTPYAELYHYESASRGAEDSSAKIKRFEHEHALMRKRWGAVLAEDPFYNPNLTLSFEDLSLAPYPRTKTLPEFSWRAG